MLHSHMQITGDVAEIQDFDSFISMRFLQNASVDGEDFHLCGDCIEIILDSNRRPGEDAANLSAVREIHATINASFEQKSHSGKADRISIYPAKKILILDGNGEITDSEEGTVRGEKLIFDSANRQIIADGSAKKRSVISIDGDAAKKSSNRFHGPEKLNGHREK
ncbi:MAG: hypothetical protein LBI61_00315 [Puniceicoccales bacterium]|nr:hypothetical protein [Puniceicoccales bacterium]